MVIGHLEPPLFQYVSHTSNQLGYSSNIILPFAQTFDPHANITHVHSTLRVTTFSLERSKLTIHLNGAFIFANS